MYFIITAIKGEFNLSLVVLIEIVKCQIRRFVVLSRFAKKSNEVST